MPEPVQLGAAPSDEPIPVIALEYHQDDEHAPWLAVVRLLSILCIISSGINAVLSGYTAWFYFDRTFRAMYARTGFAPGWVLYLAVVLSLDVVLSAILALGAAGCLRRIEGLRRLTVVACWMRLGLAGLMTVGNVGMYASRSIASIWQSIPQILGRELTGSVLLTFAMAVIFARPEVKRAFTMRDAPVMR